MAVNPPQFDPNAPYIPGSNPYGEAIAAAYLAALASASAINQQSSLASIQRNRLADNNPIPIVYGEAQVGGRPFAINYDSGTWTVGYLLCMGEIESFVSVLINDAAPADGVTINYYKGITAQTADPLLSAAIDGYADTLVVADPAGDLGIAYIVLEYTDAIYDSWPTVVVQLQGLKVWNPATQTTVYSTNPALHLGDLLSNAVYGLKQTVDDTALEAAQDYCDDTSLGEVRRKSYFVIDSPQRTEEWAGILRVYAGVFLVTRADTVYLVPDKAASSVMTIGAADIEEGSIVISKSDSSDVPSVVRAYYTDTTGDKWRAKLCDPAKAAGVDAGTTQWRESRIQLPGIKRHSQAYRECVERLNKLALSDLRCSWVQFDEALELEVGDIVSLSHPFGLSSKLLRLTEQPRQVSPGRWAVSGAEYDPAAYSDEIATTPSFADGSLPLGGIPTAPTGLVLGEYNYQIQNGDYASRLTASWTAPVLSFVTGYEVTVHEGAVLVWTGSTAGVEITTSPLKEGVLYTVSVAAYNSLYSGAAASSDYTIVGKSAIPGDVTDLSGFEAGGEVRLWWVAPSGASDYDVRRYEARYYLTSETWSDGTVIDAVDSLRVVTRDVPAGDWRFGVKAIDSIRQYSVNATEIDITVTLDDDAYRAGDIEPVSTHDTLTLVYDDLVKALGGTQYYSTSSESWDTLFPAAMTTYTNSVASYQTATGTSYWYSEELDLLQDLSGTFRSEMSYTDHNGTAVLEMGLKTAAGSYAWSTSLSQNGTARYVQLRIYSTGIFEVDVPAGYIYTDVVAREEVGTATTTGSPAKVTVTLDNIYAAVRSVSCLAQGTTAITCTVDNIVMGDPTTFDIYTFNSSGAAAAATVQYTFKGV